MKLDLVFSLNRHFVINNERVHQGARLADRGSDAGGPRSQRLPVQSRRDSPGDGAPAKSAAKIAQGIVHI